MRLLLLCPTFLNQSETFIYALLQKQKNFDVRVVCYNSHNLDVFNFSPQNIFTLRGKFWTEVLTLLGVKNKLFSWLNDFEPDVIHAHFLPSNKLALAIQRWFGGRPQIALHVHGQDFFLPAKLKQNNYLHKYLQAEVILTPSDFVAQHVRKFTKSPVYCYYTAIENDFVYQDPTPPTAEVKLMMLGRMVDKKGYEYGIKALALLGPGYRLDIVGSGPLKSKLEALARGLNVNFWEIKDNLEVRDMLSAVDLFLVPSIIAANGDSEGLPRTITEALALGTPVIATKHSGIPEAIIDHQTGLLVEEKDPEAIAEAIRWAVKNWAEMVKYAQAGKQHFENLFGKNRKKLISKHYSGSLKEFLENLEG